MTDDLSHLVGRTVVSVDGLHNWSERVTIRLSDGSRVDIYHEHECCELVCLADLSGDASDLVGQVVEVAEWREGEAKCSDFVGETRWTFGVIRTNKGTVDMRWYGESNGYYSISVSVEVSYE